MASIAAIRMPPLEDHDNGDEQPRLMPGGAFMVDI